MYKLLLLVSFILLLHCQNATAQFSLVSPLKAVTTSSDTKEKPQSKVWMHDDKFWTVLCDTSGTHLYRLDETTWRKMLQISTSSNARADCKVVNNVVHILLFRRSTTYLVSLEYVQDKKTYQPWAARTDRVPFHLHPLAQTATIDIDSNQRMWLASDADSLITVCWSDFPYENWSKPIVVASGINADDIGTVIALPIFKKIGVFWSNQNTKRFGFKTHSDGSDPETWSSDEVPASQSALNIGDGMADDHLNLAVSSNGTLYCAVKTSYDKTGYPRLALLIRRSSGIWDPLYEVSQSGTRGIAVLNENYGKLRIIYTSSETGGNILYKETATDRIAFGPEQILMNGNYNHSTSLKENKGSKTVILASDSEKVVGVLATDFIKPQLSISPNPFSHGATIAFTMPESGEYSLKIYDLMGECVQPVKTGYARAGEKHFIDMDGKRLLTGIYILRLKTKRNSHSLKIVRT